ncbi:unnamed protein product [Calypogeia fissa]
MRMAFVNRETSTMNYMRLPSIPPPPPPPTSTRFEPRERWTSCWVEAILAAAAIMTATMGLGLFVLFFVQLSIRRVQGTFEHLPRSRIVESDVGVVATDHVLCSDIGVDVLKKGGNAVDAAVAVAFCLGIANPGASGIGGGDFMLVRLADGRADAIDMRETAPLHASESMYATNLPGKTVGGLAVGVPGQVKGLYEAWKRYGTLPWDSLVEPAIKLGADGFPVQPYLASQIQGSLSAILADKGLRDVFAPDGIPLLAGELCYRKKLAETLEAIATNGSDAFYSGPIAEALVADVQAAGGILTMEDLAGYEVICSEPVKAETWGYTVLGMPPPSSGGPGLILILNILAAFKNDVQAINGDLGVHHIAEAMKHTYAVRAYLADPLFENVSSVVADMTSLEFAASLQKTIADNTTFGPEHYGGKYHPMSEGHNHGTSHFSIVDGERNAVSMTCTINYPFGAKFLSEKTGIILNNEMDDFSTPEDVVPPPGVPAKANFIKPYKRPLSTMSPTIVLKNGQLRAVIGGSGGIKILTTVAQALLKFLGGYDPLSAVSLPRIHHQFLPDVLNYENYTTVKGDVELLPDYTVRFLSSRGHDLAIETSGAVCQLIIQDLTRSARVPRKMHHTTPENKEVFRGRLIGVSDLRKDGYPAGI